MILVFQKICHPIALKLSITEYTALCDDIQFSVLANLEQDPFAPLMSSGKLKTDY